MVLSKFTKYFMLFEIIEDRTHDERHLSYSFNWYQDVLENLLDTQFQTLFRMSKDKFEEISLILMAYTDTIPEKTFKENLLLLLAFISHHTVFRHMREFFQIPHVTIFRRVAQMADYIFSISPNFIKLPEETEFNELSASFS